MPDKDKYRVVWYYNGKEFSESFPFYYLALAKQLQLDAFGQSATIHEV